VESSRLHSPEVLRPSRRCPIDADSFTSGAEDLYKDRCSRQIATGTSLSIYIQARVVSTITAGLERVASYWSPSEADEKSIFVAICLVILRASVRPPKFVVYIVKLKRAQIQVRVQQGPVKCKNITRLKKKRPLHYRFNLFLALLYHFFQINHDRN
jgi:hypothetical protein